MDASPPRPFQVSRPQRRSMLSRHFVGIVEKLVENGASYADLSVEAIITAGGISRSTFYVYFTDKGDLLVAMAQDVIGDLVATGPSWWDLPANASRADLHKALRVPIDSYRTHSAILDIVAEVAAYDLRVREQQQLLIDSVAASLARYIADAQSAYSDDSQLDSQRTAQWIVWMLESGLGKFAASADADEAEQLLVALTDIIWRVVYSRR